MKIRPITPVWRTASKGRDKDNGWRKCASCGAPTKSTWCGFCLEEE